MVGKPGQRAAVVISLAVIVYALFVLVGDLRAISGEFVSLLKPGLLAVLGLVVLNYLLRWVRWEFLLRRSQVRISRDRSMLSFLAGFTMTLTPGKIGELGKAYLLAKSDNVPPTKVSAVVIAERIGDITAISLLAWLGFAGGFWYIGPLLVGLILVLLPRRHTVMWITGRLERLRLLKGLAQILGRIDEELASLLAVIPLMIALALSTAAWFCEGVALYLIVHSVDQQISLGTSVSFYCTATLVGAVSFLPAGLGATEVSLTGLLAHIGLNISAAVAITLLIRFCTLWFAILIGFLALLGWRRSAQSRDEFIVVSHTPEN